MNAATMQAVYGVVSDDDEALIRSFPAYSGAGSSGFITNFLGVKTRIAFVAALDPTQDGAVESYPIPTNFHASALEWAGALRAVACARDELVIVELGAGWGPWLVSMDRAARLRGVRRVHLVGVEGSSVHVDYLRRHFVDNGLDPDAATLHHAVVGLYDGVAEFPVFADPAGNWGAAGLFASHSGIRGWLASRRLLRRLLTRGQRVVVERVPCVSLRTLLRPYTRIDLVHVDIQGDEYLVLSHAPDVLMQRVARLVIGTHSRLIEQQLFDHLPRYAWILETEESTAVAQRDGSVVCDRDGCQVWRNAALT